MAEQQCRAQRLGRSMHFALLSIWFAAHAPVSLILRQAGRVHLFACTAGIHLMVTAMTRLNLLPCQACASAAAIGRGSASSKQFPIVSSASCAA